MHDDVLERCEHILQSLEAVKQYMSSIKSADDFLTNENGQLYLDAVTLRLQVIGENIKQIENVQPQFFWNELNCDVGYMVRFRDFVSHHYEMLDHEIVYRSCINKLPKFKQALTNYLKSK